MYSLIKRQQPISLTIYLEFSRADHFDKKKVFSSQFEKKNSKLKKGSICFNTNLLTFLMMGGRFSGVTNKSNGY